MSIFQVEVLHEATIDSLRREDELVKQLENFPEGSAKGDLGERFKLERDRIREEQGIRILEALDLEI